MMALRSAVGPTTEAAWCAVIGAGFAGAAAAFHLARRARGSVVLLEQEAVPGVHASGRNAAMIRQVVADTYIADLARRGAARVRDPSLVWAEGLPFRRCGSLLLGRGPDWIRLLEQAREARAHGLVVEAISPRQAVARVPVLEGSTFDGALWTPSDGVVEIGPFLHGYLAGARAAGASILYHSKVLAIERRVRSGFVVSTGDRTIEAEVLVNAAGAWAEGVGRLAGNRSITLVARRRHLYLTSSAPGVDPGWPFVWDISSGLYFRPEGGGLLLSACDEAPAPPGIPPAEPEVEELLAQKVLTALPSMPELRIRMRWAGLRTFAGDGRFVIGGDPDVRGFYWVAGLGGHGVTCSYAVGELAARKIFEGQGAASDAFDPRRLAA